MTKADRQIKRLATVKFLGRRGNEKDVRVTFTDGSGFQCDVIVNALSGDATAIKAAIKKRQQSAVHP